MLSYIYVTAVALRLARFNVLSAGKPSTGWFTGMPSPAAGMTLAVYYPFSQTEWYRASIAYLDLQHQGLVVLVLLLALLMVSNVRYPKFPQIGLRSAKGIFGLVVHLTILIGGIFFPEYFLFPLGLFYMTFGVSRATRARPHGTAGAGAGRPKAGGAAGRSAAAPLAPERGAGWIDRRSRRTDELSGSCARDATRRVARSPGPGGGARPLRPRLRGGRRRTGRPGHRARA